MIPIELLIGVAVIAGLGVALVALRPRNDAPKAAPLAPVPPPPPEPPPPPAPPIEIDVDVDVTIKGKP